MPDQKPEAERPVHALNRLAGFLNETPPPPWVYRDLNALRKACAEADAFKRPPVDPMCVRLLSCSNCLPGDRDPRCREHTPIIEWLKARLLEELTNV